ncbi:hypothetical protein [[Kitasatospora] papulosa]|uniref:hypothetical protein n=1 Tax=[Kitasatospora] papulosa TaxID=1464011 RepID=UPI0036834752
MTAKPYATYVAGIDLVAVERVLNGTLHYEELSPEERAYAGRHSTGPARKVAGLLGVTEKTIMRWREAGEPS